MTHSSNSGEQPLPRQGGAGPEPDVELVCGHCGHAFCTPMSGLADSAASLRCPACRKAFTMNQRFAHDAVDELDKRRRADPVDPVDPVDRVLADLGKILRG